MSLLYPEESYKIRGAAFEVYKQLGNRHKENVYQRAFADHLRSLGFIVEEEKQLPVIFSGKKVGVYTPDFVINNEIFIEIKAKPFLTKRDIEQFWHYLRTSPYRLGFFINFGAPHRVQIIRRVFDTARQSSA